MKEKKGKEVGLRGKERERLDKIGNKQSIN